MNSLNNLQLLEEEFDFAGASAGAELLGSCVAWSCNSGVTVVE